MEGGGRSLTKRCERRRLLEHREAQGKLLSREGGGAKGGGENRSNSKG